MLSGDGASLIGANVKVSTRTVAIAINTIALSTKSLSASALRMSGKYFSMLARGAPGNILATMSGVSCEITDAPPEFIGPYTRSAFLFSRVSNPDAGESPTETALSAPGAGCPDSA